MLKVIIVDDDVNVGKCLNSVIAWESMGYTVVGEAFNGAEALKLVEETMPDVIITDLKMPVMDGMEFCINVRKMTDDVAIIFLSAYEDFTTTKLALRYNVTEYILKPINSQKIQLLTDILEELSENYTNRNFFNDLIGNTKKRKEIMENLKNGDIVWFQEFFQEFTNCMTGKFLAIKDASLMLISIMYSYLESVGIDSKLLEEKNENSNKELEGLRMKMDMVTFVSNIYFDVLQFQDYKIGGTHHSIIEQVKKYIEINCSDSMFGVSDVADKFHFSPDYISKIFGRYTGTTINAYITEVRMQKSIKLLRETDLAVTKIAQMVGYSNLNYFARVFKKQMNLTPSEYRTQLLMMNGGVSNI